MRIAAPSLELNAVTGNDPAKIDKVSRQLEGQFAQMLIKSMRAASFGDSLFPGENQMFREMYDQRIAEAMTKGRGLGLSSMIARQLGGADKAAQPLDTSLVPAAKAAQAYRLLAPAPATTAPMALPAPQAALQADPLQAVAASAPAMPQEQMLDLIAGRDSGSLHAAIGGRGTAPEAAPATADWALANDRWSGVGPAAPRSDGVDVATANAAADQLGKHTPEGFVASIWPHAEKAARELGVDPRALVAQAALETGWGRRHIKRDNGSSSHNLFGIKASGWKGESASAATHEYVDGQRQSQTARFRAYGSPAESFGDYVRMLKNSPRYQAALQAGSDVRGFAQGLQRAGYATDPGYAAKIAAIAAGPTIDRAVAAIGQAGTRLGQTFAQAAGLAGITRR
ncbi:MAG: flagellar assembly peptidoglycan hydrolase FlgJ [Stenotrophomonas acidaminiphila]|uniref:flagellar assembly peptidoglycan hydrolase FlgJ n=1 Tax=Stenotrophomonas acidaminiphila TaxID=128780 RepID=UPI000963CD1A|nr:flagellar assembly peptidoglycan hydrolase FlgJ [Stenotrophomonas acidaminiphila]MBN8803142.1 flagellar assembly peptidoglycan hydrolase FlgJ [Stenotrophomonas acidaminiphila]MDF9441347.1 flagellar assembly peptidoglycan hydrolase FlgJ [Stenotrophomonas acidaminiphila]OJY75620.1 MAG: flagellar rod assembly protein/muramidase FlgJ [Stenotrophomonas sp. 69-14]